MATQTQQDKLAAQILASIKTKNAVGGSATPVTDIIADSFSGVVSGAAQLGGALRGAGSNAVEAFRLERGVQQVRAEKKLEEMAQRAAARILALG